MENKIKGRRLTFGDPEQIQWLRQQARLIETSERGYVIADVEENPLKARLIKDQVVLVRFTCPGCLERHQFSPHLMERAVDYTAPCGLDFWYDIRDERLTLTTSIDKPSEK